MPHLYINSRGVPWRKHSYSSGNIFDQSPLKYYLMKVSGWKERDNRGSFMFGRALEESIQHHNDHNGEGAVEDFKRRWAAHQDKDITYTDKEGDWAQCLKMGTDMIRLYSAMQPVLPIPLGGRSVFQREYAKEVFPGDPNYGGIEDAGKLDIVAYVDPAHPMLPKIDWKLEYGALRPLIVDIKTSATDFPEQPGIAAFDTQLRRYSWQSGIRDVSLLWFVKKGLSLKKGYTITTLEKNGVYEPGEEAIIAATEQEHAYIVKSDFMLLDMDRVIGKTKDEQIKHNWLDQHATRVAVSSITKQKMQFNAGTVTQQSADDAGRIAGRQIVQIVNAWKDKNWPNTFGIRYPKDDRNDPYFRAFVFNDEAYRKQNFTKSDEESFDNLFQEEHE